MSWVQTINPSGNLAVSALIAAIPILFFLFALATLRMKAHLAALFTVALAILVSCAFHGMPVKFSVLSVFYGALFGLWPIGWIVLTAVFLYNLTVRTGQFEIIRGSITSITNDRRLQALLIAFSFGAFLEGTAGFGTPVAITAAMLVGLGFNPLYAAGICLIANTAPVAWGAVGIPVITAGAVTGIDAMTISQMIGRQLPFLSLFVPFWLVFVMSGWKGAKEIWPAIAVSGVSFAAVQWFSSNYLSPMLPDILSSLTSMIALVLFLRVWQPKSIWKFKDEPERAPAGNVAVHSAAAIFKAWLPFIILTILIADWGLSPVKTLLDRVNIPIVFSALNKAIIIGGKPLEVIYTFNWLSGTGTAILIAGLITAFVLRIKAAEMYRIFADTLKSLRFALLTIALVLGFSYVANWSGMTPTLGKAFTVAGTIFPFLSAFLGWLGVFITGSDTSSNALFAKMQQVTAQSTGINPVLTVAANSSGGVMGKMISPQSIVVGTSSTGLTGREGDLFRFTLPHSIFLTVIVGLITVLQAYVFPWMIPSVKKAALVARGAAGGGPLILFVTVILILFLISLALHETILNPRLKRI
ncbi:MAG: L-lactate transport [Desulfotomaculum sp. 46_296]|nr:MAG: L-lactate transport [Desulfotomaculum sp. 46_296]HAU30974.1 lactate permease [Desulfotomaculum sp.]